MLKKIYAEIVEHTAGSKVSKAERIKYKRPQILKYLKKRYPTRIADIIFQQINFPF